MVSVDISTVLSFPIHELEISFHLLMYSLVSFTHTFSLVFSIQIFSSLFTFILNLLLWLKYYCKWESFINFIFRLFIVSVYKHNWFWHTDLIFFNFAEFTYFFLKYRSCKVFYTEKHVSCEQLILFLSNLYDYISFSCL